jgi:hypothetical protein
MALVAHIQKTPLERCTRNAENLELLVAAPDIQQRSDFCMGVMMTRAAFYVRVSTESQSLENQLQALQAVADKRGWQVADTYTDFAVSGAKGRLQRPGLDRLCKDAQRGKFDLVAGSDDCGQRSERSRAPFRRSRAVCSGRRLDGFMPRLGCQVQHGWRLSFVGSRP